MHPDSFIKNFDLSKIQANLKPLDNGCIHWLGKAPNGVPKVSFYVPELKTTITFYVYRVLWVSKNGLVGDGLSLHRTCTDPACVNPDHRQARIRQQSVNARLDPDKAREIRRLDKAGMSTRWLSLRYGVSVSVIRKIIIGQSWKEE